MHEVRLLVKRKTWRLLVKQNICPDLVIIFFFSSLSFISIKCFAAIDSTRVKFPLFFFIYLFTFLTSYAYNRTFIFQTVNFNAENGSAHQFCYFQWRFNASLFLHLHYRRHVFLHKITHRFFF